MDTSHSHRRRQPNWSMSNNNLSCRAVYIDDLTTNSSKYLNSSHLTWHFLIPFSFVYLLLPLLPKNIGPALLPLVPVCFSFIFHISPIFCSAFELLQFFHSFLGGFGLCCYVLSFSCCVVSLGAVLVLWLKLDWWVLGIMAAFYVLPSSPLPLSARTDLSQLDRRACFISGELGRPMVIST